MPAVPEATGRRALVGPLSRLAVTGVVLTYLGLRIDLDSVAGAALRIDGTTWFLLLIVTATDRVVAATRWLVLVASAGIDLPALQGLRLFLVSSFVGSFLPAGIGGDVARTWELANRTGRTSEALGIAALDRWLGLASVLTLGAVGVALPSDVDVDPRVGVVMYAGLAGVLAAGAAAGFGGRRAAWLLPERWAGPVSRVAASLRCFRRPSAIGLVVGLSLATQVLRIVLAWLVGRGLAIDVPLSYYFAVMPIGIVLILLPISIGGLGPAQGAIVWMLRPAGVAEELSLAMSTVYILLGVAGNVPGAALFLWSRQGAPHRWRGPAAEADGEAWKGKGPAQRPRERLARGPRPLDGS